MYCLINTHTHRQKVWSVQGFPFLPTPTPTHRLTHKIAIFVSVCTIHSCLCHYKWNSIVYAVCLASFVKYHVTSTGFQKLQLTCEPNQGWNGFEKPWLVLVGSTPSSIGGVLEPQWNGARTWNADVSWEELPGTGKSGLNIHSFPDLGGQCQCHRALGESWCELDNIRIFEAVSNCFIFCSISNISVWSRKNSLICGANGKHFTGRDSTFCFYYLFFLFYVSYLDSFYFN